MECFEQQQQKSPLTYFRGFIPAALNKLKQRIHLREDSDLNHGGNGGGCERVWNLNMSSK